MGVFLPRALRRGVRGARLGGARAHGRAHTVRPSPEASTRAEGALALLALLQREGRIVDFLEQDVATFSDADVGTAARVVHEGCRRALRQHVTIVASCKEDEGASLEVEPGFDPNRMKLTGNVSGKGPWRGTVRHRGWIAQKVSLPEPMPGHDAKALAPAEVEL